MYPGSQYDELTPLVLVTSCTCTDPMSPIMWLHSLQRYMSVSSSDLGSKKSPFALTLWPHSSRHTRSTAQRIKGDKRFVIFHPSISILPIRRMSLSLYRYQADSMLSPGLIIQEVCNDEPISRIGRTIILVSCSIISSRIRPSSMLLEIEVCNGVPRSIKMFSGSSTWKSSIVPEGPNVSRSLEKSGK